MGMLANLPSLEIILGNPGQTSSSGYNRQSSQDRCHHGVKMAHSGVPIIGTMRPLRTLDRQSSPVHPAFLSGNNHVQSCGRHTLSAVLA